MTLQRTIKRREKRRRAKDRIDRLAAHPRNSFVTPPWLTREMVMLLQVPTVTYFSNRKWEP